MLSAEWIRKQAGDEECLRALASLAEKAESYPSGLYTPPLKRSTKPNSPISFVAATFRVRRASRQGGTRIARIDYYDGSDSHTIEGETAADITGALAAGLLKSTSPWRFIITTGQRRNVLDVWLECLGPSLLARGYSLQPCVTGGGVSFITIRKGKRSWTLVYLQTMTGLDEADSLRFARSADESPPNLVTVTRTLHAATDAVQSFLLDSFGVALKATAGMIALACARRFMPETDYVWRPVPLLVAMERVGGGYRGGMQFASKFKGRSWRIDVNRQYTNALRSPLPLRVAFGRYKDADRTPHGVYVCRVRAGSTLRYPLSVWRDKTGRWERGIFGAGEYVCILHTSEFDGLTAAGWIIRPDHGFTFTHTFDLSEYVECLQVLCDRYGKESPEGKLTKPLGNYVYGKFGQKPERMELLYAPKKPDASWHPYIDSNGKDWSGVWERKTTRYTSTMHVQIAGTITGFARSQTAATWAYLSAFGLTIQRCHTDSLTLDRNPAEFLALDGTTIGEWKLENADVETVIATANGYVDERGAHLAGVENPSIEEIERLYDGHVVYIAREQNLPRQGWRREKRVQERQYRAVD